MVNTNYIVGVVSGTLFPRAFNPTIRNVLDLPLLALEKEMKIVKEETALRKEKEAIYCYAVQGCIQSYIIL